MLTKVKVFGVLGNTKILTLFMHFKCIYKMPYSHTPEAQKS